MNNSTRDSNKARRAPRQGESDHRSARRERAYGLARDAREEEEAEIGDAGSGDSPPNDDDASVPFEREADDGPQLTETSVPDLLGQLRRVCTEARNAIQTKPPGPLRTYLNGEVTTQLNTFWMTSTEARYCFLCGVYSIVASIVMRDMEEPGAFTKRLLGPSGEANPYLELIKRIATLPTDPAEKRKAQDRFSDYNCGLKEAAEQELTTAELFKRLKEDGGIGALLKAWRLRGPEEGRPVRGQRDEPAEQNTSDEDSCDQPGSADREPRRNAANQPHRGAGRGFSSLNLDEEAPRTAPRRGLRLSTSRANTPLAVFEVADEAVDIIKKGDGEYVGFIRLTHSSPPVVEIRLIDSLPHHGYETDEEALDRMIAAVRSNRRKG